MTVSILPEVAWLFFLMFARLGSLAMLLPTLGERLLPSRQRLAFALATTLVLYPVVSQTLPAMPADFTGMIALFFVELAIGIGLGLLVRLVVSSMTVAGNIIAFQMGLGFAMSVDPTQGAQGALVGNFLGLVGTMMVFAGNLHHLAIGGLLDCFVIYPPGEFLPFSDMADMATKLVGESFKIGVQISAPFIVFGLVFNLGLGLLSRLMPQLQIYMIAMPLNILGGFVLLAVLMTALVTLYIDHVTRFFSLLLLR